MRLDSPQSVGGFSHGPLKRGLHSPAINKLAQIFHLMPLVKLVHQMRGVIYESHGDRLTHPSLSEFGHSRNP
jgi:hypothetical protein